MRRSIVAVFLLFVALVCSWVPWRAPGLLDASTDNSVIDPRPDPSGATVQLGYAWIWSGPGYLQGSLLLSEKELADAEKVGRMKAEIKAKSESREPTQVELDDAAVQARAESISVSRTRTYYHDHAKPDLQRIGLELIAGTALAGVLYGLTRKRHREPHRGWRKA